MEEYEEECEEEDQQQSGYEESQSGAEQEDEGHQPACGKVYNKITVFPKFVVV